MAPFGFTLLGFFTGSIPFSVWLGRMILGTDIRRFGRDRNPGAVNAWRAGSWRVGLPVLVLDFLKGALPVGLAVWVSGITGWESVPVALAPVLGHAISPFLRFKGGKSLAVTFGVWTGLLPGSGPFALGIALAIFYLLFTNDAWAVVFGLLGFLGYLSLAGASLPLLSIWAGNMLILAWTHRLELRAGIHLRFAHRRA